MQFLGRTEEYLILKDITRDNCTVLKERIESSLSMIWSKEDDTHLIIDGQAFHLLKDQLIFLTEFHKVEIKRVDKVRLIRFNRPFYCIHDNDSEVGCKGLLFFGASNVPRIHIPKEDLDKFETVYKMFVMEMESKDKLQIEMLQMMLKRFIILCTRLYKEQSVDNKLDEPQIDLVRSFSYLVEMHYKEKHGVAEYADLLNKSPKTLSNVFSKHQEKRPLQIIQERILLEARRLLAYSDSSVKEIAYELGFDSIQGFSRLFKNKEGVSPVDYRKSVVHAN